MKNNVKSAEEVYNEVKNYIEGDKHNRPCTLMSIKKELRTPEIVELIFSRPDIFKLSAEYKHVPEESLTEDILMKFVLADPRNFALIDESRQTLPVMIAFEFAKRRMEYISARHWGSSGVHIGYSGKALEYRNDISDMCDRLKYKCDEDELLRNYLLYIEEVYKDIRSYCLSLNSKLDSEEKYESELNAVDLGLNKRLYILVSGYHDSGKTIFSDMLASKIKDAVSVDSDSLLEKGLLFTKLDDLVDSNAKVVVFSDIYAHEFFEEKEFANADVIKLLVKPESFEKMCRHTQYFSFMPFSIYKHREINSVEFYETNYDIIVTNNYTNAFEKEVDRTILEICEHLGITANLNTQPSSEGPSLSLKNKDK